MSAKHTPGPWRLDAGSNYAGGPGFRVLAKSTRPKPTPSATGEIQIALPPPHGNGDGREQEQEANARLIAAAPDLKAVAANFEITGPDDDGLVWLHLYGQGTTGKAMFQLGSPDRVAVQVALLLEGRRKAAIAKAGGRT